MEAAFEQVWATLAPLGRDPRSGGYRRLAWTPVDLRLRAWFREQAERRGLSVEHDRNGNLWAWLGVPGPGAVVTGSHLDSVPDGGAYDGPLGVVSALLALDELRARGTPLQRPVAVLVCSDEEGARAGVACVGSRLMTGSLDPDLARDLRDRDGVRLADAMEQAGADPSRLGRDDEALGRIGAFVELHVEQGRALVHLDAAVGVATAIWPHGRWHLRFDGAPDHAGTTRLADRHDPVLPLAAAVLAARELAERAGAVATVGRVQVVPGAVNAVAASADAWLDCRAATDDVVQDVVAGVVRAAEQAGRDHGVAVQVVQESATPLVAFDDVLRRRVSSVLGGVPELPTAAGHDAGVLSAQVPSAMLFVRNPTGVSHSPAEHADAADCVAGVHALADVLADLAGP